MAPSTYYAAKRREREPSARAVRDAAMMQVLMALWVVNRKVYGARKLWKAARRAGHDIGRDQTARLMRELGIEGVSRRRKRIFTTVGDPDAVRAPDLVARTITADAPNRWWVAAITYGRTVTGWVSHLAVRLQDRRRSRRRSRRSASLVPPHTPYKAGSLNRTGFVGGSRPLR